MRTNKNTNTKKNNAEHQTDGLQRTLSVSSPLAREADIELAHGHYFQAERLAWRAYEMQEAGR